MEIDVQKLVDAVETASNLDQLYTAILNLDQAPLNSDYDSDEIYSAQKSIDWASLPTFGGTEPEDTHEILSWDEERLLVQTGSNCYSIVDRDDRDEE